MISLSHALVVCTVVSKTSSPVALIDSPFAAVAGDVAGPIRSFSAGEVTARQSSRLAPPPASLQPRHQSRGSHRSDPLLYAHRVDLTLTGVNSPIPAPGVLNPW